MSQQQQQQENRLINVGAGWVKKSQSGAEYLALKVNQDIPSGSWIKAFWTKDKQSEQSPDLSLAGNESDGFQQVDYGQGRQQQQGQQHRGGGNRPPQQQQQQRGGQRGGYNNGGNHGGNRGGYQGHRGGGNQGGRGQQQRGRWYEDDINPEEIPF